MGMDKIITAFLALIGIFALLFFVTTSLGDYNKGTVIHKNGEIKVFVFNTPYELMTGLTDKGTIDEDEGAFFFLGKKAMPQFITKDMGISVDMIWISEEMNVVGITENVPPCYKEYVRDCPTYSPKVLCQYVIEVNGGYAKRHDIKTGDHLEFIP